MQAPLFYSGKDMQFWCQLCEWQRRHIIFSGHTLMGIQNSVHTYTYSPSIPMAIYCAWYSNMVNTLTLKRPCVCRGLILHAGENRSVLWLGRRNEGQRSSTLAQAVEGDSPCCLSGSQPAGSFLGRTTSFAASQWSTIPLEAKFRSCSMGHQVHWTPVRM